MKRILAAVASAALISGAWGKDQPAHHERGGFVNPYSDHTPPGLSSFLRARFFSGDWAAYDPAEYQTPVREPEPVAADGPWDNAAVTWLGHSTVLIQYQGLNVLTDPILTKRASPVAFAGPKRISPPGLSVAQLPRIDVVVISHDHYDHLDFRTVRQLGPTTRYFVPLGLKRSLLKQGVDAQRVIEMDWWDAQAVEVGGRSVRIVATPSQHFSGRGAFDRNRSLWASWVLEWSDFTAWFGGDTGYNDVQFAEIGQKFPEIDLGIIPIGAYAPSWFMRPVHVDPSEAVLIHQDIGATRSMGVHWGTFMLAAEPVDEPPRRLAEEVLAAGLSSQTFTTYAVGETRRYRR